VMIGRNAGAWQVHTDNVLGGRLAVEHLVGLGHRRFAFFGWSLEGVPSILQRREGFESALREAGIDPASAPAFAHRERDAFAACLQSGNAPTAVCCYNDEVAVQLLDLCRELHLRVPEDISIVGFDDNILATTTRPRLTTIHSPTDALARMAVEMMQRQMRDEKPPEAPVLLAPWLVVRETTAPPRCTG
jgi:DNA-binding LacI/PurR family transcriptional regulator